VKEVPVPCPCCAATATTAQPRRTALGYRTFRCDHCRRIFNERTGTPYKGLFGERENIVRSGHLVSRWDTSEVGRGGSPRIVRDSVKPTAGSGTTTVQAGLADFYAKLAANLGIGQDKLTAAVAQTDQQQIDAAVAAGTLTPAQAARDRIANSPNGLPPFGNGNERGRKGGGRNGEQQSILAAEAAFFGITPAQLQQDLLTAGSVQGVAAKYGKDNATNKAALQAALVAAQRQDLTTKGVATAQVEQEVTAFAQNFDQFYTGTRGQRVPKPATSPVPSASPVVSQ
jgi:hypothetical protein